MIVEPDIVTIPAGPIVLGDTPIPTDFKLPHRWQRREVNVPKFGIGRYPVTVREYLAFADATGYAIAPELRTDARFANLKAPATYVSWIDAVRYTQWLARQANKPYRLVRDAEYEKAARGGQVGKRFPWGDEPPPGRADWNNASGKPMSVGSFPPNDYGIHDMVGSVYSWCEECFDQVVKDDRAKMIYDDTQLRDVRLNAICRGGSFKTGDPHIMYCAYRHEDPTDGRYDCIGFRVALSL